MKSDASPEFKIALAPFRDFAEAMERQRAEGFGWRYDGISDWSTDAIFVKLRELGVDTDADRFVAQASAAGGFKALDDEWYRQATENESKDIGLWADLIMFAVPELWQRLAGNVKCWELIERRLDKAIVAEEGGEPLPEVNGAPATRAAIEGALDYFESLPEAQRRSEFEAMNQDYDYGEWFYDQVCNDREDRPESALRIANFLEVVGEKLLAGNAAASAAEILGDLNRREEAIDHIRRSAERYPDNDYVLRTAGDLLSKSGHDAEAIERWTEALPLIDNRWLHDEVIEDIEAALERTGRSDELPAMLEKYPRPAEPLPPPATNADAFESPPAPRIERPRPIRVAPKIGRNDPCPCGSGKKYKKCCLKS